MAAATAACAVVGAAGAAFDAAPVAGDARARSGASALLSGFIAKLLSVSHFCWCTNSAIGVPPRRPFHSVTQSYVLKSYVPPEVVFRTEYVRTYLDVAEFFGASLGKIQRSDTIVRTVLQI
jgi:hypothetical protein